MSALSDSIRSGVAAAVSRTAGVRVAYVFGSQLTGSTWAESDLDIAVRWDRELDATARAERTLALIATLTDLLGELGERADIVDLDRVGSAIAFRAIRDGVRVHGASKAECVQAVVDVMRRYDDDAPRRELFRRAAVAAVARMPEAPRGRP